MHLVLCNLCILTHIVRVMSSLVTRKKELAPSCVPSRHCMRAYLHVV